MAGNGNSGRPAKPTVLHLLDGNKSKKAFGALMDDLTSPAVPVQAPPMPDCMTDEAVAEWERLIPDLELLGLISKLDMMALATYCEAVADWKRFRRRIHAANADREGAADKGDVQVFKTGATQISVWRQLANDAEKRANAAGAMFGFSPMARRNLKVTPPQGDLFPNEHRDAANKYFSS